MAHFETKIRLKDSKVRQLSGDTVNLSGTTRFVNAEYINGLPSGYTNNSFADVGFVTNYTQPYKLNEVDFFYISSGGSDVTGDGTSSSTAFATFDKLVETIKNGSIYEFIFVNVGSGTFSIDALFDEYFVGSRLKLFISGDGFSVVESLVSTTGSTDAFNKDAEISGVSPNWTVNEHRGRFVRHSNSVYPIASNGTDTIEFTDPYYEGATEIVQHNTILTGSLFSDDLLIRTIEFDEVNIQHSGAFIVESDYIGLYDCSIIADRINTKCNILYFDNTYINSIMQINDSYNTSLYLYESVYYEAPYIATAYIDIINNVENIISDSIFDITNATSSSQIFNLYSVLTLSDYVKLKNAGQGFLLSSNAQILQNDLVELILDNVDYIFQLNPNVINSNCVIPASKIFGMPNNDYVLNYPGGIVNLDNQIYIENLNYPEIENDLQQTLISGTTTNTPVGDIIQNQRITLDYYVIRGTNEASGIFEIKYDGTTIEILRDEISGDTVGLTLDSDFDSVDPNLINLQATLDSTGDNATFKYNARRVMQ